MTDFQEEAIRLVRHAEREYRNGNYEMAVELAKSAMDGLHWSESAHADAKAVIRQSKKALRPSLWQRTKQFLQRVGHRADARRDHRQRHRDPKGAGQMKAELNASIRRGFNLSTAARSAYFDRDWQRAVKLAEEAMTLLPSTVGRHADAYQVKRQAQRRIDHPNPSRLRRLWWQVDTGSIKPPK